jgi:hypothetical protein
MRGDCICGEVAFEVVGNLPKLYQCHCSNCGSIVPNPFRDKPYVWVPAGALDDSQPLEIAVHICVGSKASWDNQIPAELTQFEDRPTLTELIDLVHANANT